MSPADPERPSTDAARRAAELAARASCGRLVAMAAARTRDIAGAEDALADAFAAALARWPEVGVPARPEAWLLTVARRGLMRRARHRRVVDASTTALVAALEARADDRRRRGSSAPSAAGLAVAHQREQAAGLGRVRQHRDEQATEVERRGARRDADGRFVPLARQDTTRWDTALVVEAERQLTEAARARTFGRFQCEAAIQSVHAQRAITGVLHHDALLTLYGMLLAYAPTVGVAVARAAALLAAGAADEARRALDALAPEDVRTYAPYWVTRAHLAAHTGDADARAHALTTALGLTEAPSVRRFLEAELGR